jgi:Arc/MetJ family transcription regulator
MARTNIDIDEEACALVMRQKGFTTKRDAVNYALRRAAVTPMTTEELLAMRGSIPDFPTLEQIRPTEDPW